MTKLELLSPARTADIGIEAIRHGADAVYIGAPRFGARAAAGNSIEDIARLVDFAHLYGARVYVTVNTLLHDDELADVERLIHQLYDIHVDALIVQDPRLLHMALPPIPLHASTQMDNQTPEKVCRLYDAGFRQVVLARELTIDQIRYIHNACPDMKLECFVHGALCVSYSGRCFVSESLFGRSANRGECAQVCRMEFDLVEETCTDGTVTERTLMYKKHLLSLKDLCLINNLRELIEAGVTSFKIEGRLKGMSYVKNVTAAYSEELNKIVRSAPQQFERASVGEVNLMFTPDVHKSFNRGFTTYFLHGRTPDIFSFDTPKAVGEEVGIVKEIYARSFTVAGLHSFTNGDGLCFFDKNGRLHGFRLNKVEAGRLYPLDMPRDIQPKMKLYRNFDKRFDDQLNHESAERFIYADMALSETPSGFRLSMSDDNGMTVSSDFECEKQLARTHQSENIERQLSKLGDTVFRLRTLNIQLSKNWFIPSSTLSQWRRHVSRQLMDKASELRAEPVVVKDADCTQQIELPPSAPLMTCRHCIKYSLGKCRQAMPPLLLKMTDGVHRLHLDFDCSRCVMKVTQLLIFVLLMCSCRDAVNSFKDVRSDSLTTDVLYTDTLLELTQQQADSLNFRLSHHYTNNFNFLVRADSIELLPLNESNADTAICRRGDIIAVADISMQSDTVWVKVARDQTTMGWVREEQLLTGTIPNDTISILICRLSGSRLLWMAVMAAVGLLLFVYRRMFRISVLRYQHHIDMLHPCLFIMVVSVVACLYASIQMWIPEFWQEYYFHPTLNPFILPPIMALLVALVWLAIIVFVALIMEVCRRMYFIQGTLFVLETCGLATLAYLSIAYTTPFYVGYLLLPIIIVALIVYIRKSTFPFSQMSRERSHAMPWRENV